MNCCVQSEYKKLIDTQEQLLEAFADAHDEIHTYLSQALTCLSSEHPAGAAAHIGRCLYILEQSKDDMVDMINDSQDEDEDDE